MLKGVVLKHKNLAFAVQSNLYGLSFSDNGAMLSYLPLAHIFGVCGLQPSIVIIRSMFFSQRFSELGCMALGAKIGYFTGDPLRLLEDAQILKPHFFPAVPRVLNRVYHAAMAGGDVPGLRGNIFRKAVATKVEKLRRTGDPTHVFWDKLVFRKVRDS